MTPRPADDEPSLTVPLPSFRQPPASRDPELATVPSPSPAPAPDDEPAAPSPTDPDRAAGEPEPPSPMPDPRDRTATFSAGRRGGAGDPRQAARMVAGLLAIIAGTAAAVLYRRGRLLRQPSPGQLFDIGQPLGRLLVRYLPLDVVGPTLVDVTEAAAATHAYVLDGPLVVPLTSPPPVPEGEEPA